MHALHLRAPRVVDFAFALCAAMWCASCAPLSQTGSREQAPVGPAPSSFGPKAQPDAGAQSTQARSIPPDAGLTDVRPEPEAPLDAEQHDAPQPAPTPAMSLDWKYRRSARAGHPELEQLKIEQDGSATFEFAWSDLKGRCAGRVSAATHTSVVHAAQALLRDGGCKSGPMRPEIATRLVARIGAWKRACAITMSVPGYPAFAAAVKQAADEACRR